MRTMNSSHLVDLYLALVQGEDDFPQWIDDRTESEFVAWMDACDDTGRAYHHWRAVGGADAYAVYRAAADREDKAQDELAEAARRSRRRHPTPVAL
jgi:hypothetical protein